MGDPRNKVNHDSLWTSANIVTLLRICGVPLFIVVILSPWPVWFGLPPGVAIWKQWIAAGVFVLLAATDGLDGYLARTYGEITDFGKLIDPLADKILVAAALIALVELNVLPSWVVLIVLGREFIVSGIRVVAAARGVVLAASWYGKVKTVVQIVAIVLFIVKDSHMFSSFSSVTADGLYLISWGVMFLALVLTIVSMFDYFMKSKDVFMPRAGGKAEISGASVPPHATDRAPAASVDEKLSSGFFEQAQSLVRAYRARGLSLGFAESCTGGLVAAACTEVPGSSEVIRGGIVSYSNEVKDKTLGVDKETLGRFGAVSEQCACEMAQGARSVLACDIAVSVTGIAGPDGGSAEKPVGTVWIGWSDEYLTYAVCHRFPGSRAQVRMASVQAVLDLLIAHSDTTGSSSGT